MIEFVSVSMQRTIVTASALANQDRGSAKRHAHLSICSQAVCNTTSSGPVSDWNGRLGRQTGKADWKGRLRRKTGEADWKGRLRRKTGEADWNGRLEMQADPGYSYMAGREHD